MNEGLAGPLALVLVGLWVAYLVPQVLRHRQQLLDSRADDRYSEALRVVAVTSRRPGSRGAHRPSRSARRGPAPAVRSDCGRTGHATGLLTPGRGQQGIGPTRGEGGTAVDRPHATGQRRSAEAARELARTRAVFAAAVTRRGAAARRRGVLAGMLAFASVAGWASVVWLPSATIVVGLVPSALLVLVVGLGRRAVVSGRQHDEQWRARIADLEGRGARAATTATGARTAVGPRRPHADLATTAIPTAAESAGEVVGRAVHPSAAPTDAFAAIVTDQGEHGGAARHASGAIPVVDEATDRELVPALAEPEPEADGHAWNPVALPPPTYVLKPAAPRRDPAPLPEPDLAQDEVKAPRVPVLDEAPVQTTGSIDLDAVLERRRASGL